MARSIDAAAQTLQDIADIAELVRVSEHAGLARGGARLRRIGVVKG